MQSIVLTQGYYASVDDVDYDWLNQYKWYYTKSGYAVRNNSNHDGIVYMHKVIFEKYNPEYVGEVDHKDLNKLHNWQENLRPATNSQQEANKPLSLKSSSGYKGVTWAKSKGKWKAQIKHNQINNHLGYFNSAVAAAKVYDAAAKAYFGEFANVNFSE